MLGLEIPEEYGGNIVPPVQQAAVMEELARGDAGLGLDILVQNSLTAFPIARFGTDAQKQRYLPRMASGELIACFGLTEPNTGSDAKAIRLKATWDDSEAGLDRQRCQALHHQRQCGGRHAAGRADGATRGSGPGHHHPAHRDWPRCADR